MTNAKFTWQDARAIETNLASKIENALREGGLPEELIEEYMNTRGHGPEMFPPPTEQEIERQMEESRREADHIGLKVPSLNCPHIVE